MQHDDDMIKECYDLVQLVEYENSGERKGMIYNLKIK